MLSPAVLLSSMGAYSILYAPLASQALARMPPMARGSIRQRLNEIAVVAETLASPAADDVQSTLRFEVAGYVVSYVVSDRRHVLTVLSVVPASAE